MKKTLCLSHSISQEAYPIWSWYLLQMCKRMTSPGNFFIFSKFWFCGLWRGWKGKKWPKMTKNSVHLTSNLRNCPSYDCDLWYTCVKWWYLQKIFHLLQFLIFLVFTDDKRPKNDPKLPISVCHALYHWNCRSCYQDFW